MAVADEFSFQPVSSSMHHSSPSTSLWRITSQDLWSYSDIEDRKVSITSGFNSSRTSFSYFEGEEEAAEEEEEEEEKMDMLWESFNEELHRKTSLRNNKGVSTWDAEMREMNCLKGKKGVTRRSNNNNGGGEIVVSSKRVRPNMGVVLKVFRRLLLVRKFGSNNGLRKPATAH